MSLPSFIWEITKRPTQIPHIPGSLQEWTRGTRLDQDWAIVAFLRDMLSSIVIGCLIVTAIQVYQQKNSWLADFCL